jgi:hypothetical protein
MILWVIAAICAYFVKGLCGFANTLVFTTILSFSSSNLAISPVELLLGYPTNAIMAWKERRAIQWRICVPLAVLVILGSIPGTLFLKNVDTHRIKLLFGVVIILIGLNMLYGEFHPRKSKGSRLLLGLIGLLSGLLCGLYGIGALLGAYLGRVTEDSHGFKANICVVFLVENTFRLVFYTLWGIITLERLRQALILYPFMLLGLWLGMCSSRKLDEKLVKKLVIVTLILSGVPLIVSSL